MYTTLDMNLQRDAVAAVAKGIKETDEQWKRRNKKYGTEENPLAQVALVLSRRRNRRGEGAGGRTQLWRQPARSRAAPSASRDRSFKPFVYAAAFETALDRRRERPDAGLHRGR